MSKYTVQLRTIVESGRDIFNFDYPIWDEAYRDTLEKQIIDNYYFREIGFETVAQFEFNLASRMRLIMPYYNQLYETVGLINKDNFNINQNSTETHIRDNTSNANSTVDTESENTTDTTNKAIFSDTPTSKLGTSDYATNITDGTGNASDSGTVGTVSDSETTFHEEYEVKLTGGGGLRYDSDIIPEWRKTIINIDQMVVNQLQDLFMNLY